MTKRNSIDSRSARTRLEARREPYWVKLSTGCYLGYRRSAQGQGTWLARFRDPSGKQLYGALGAADDRLESNGASVLSFDQAQSVARDWVRTTESVGRTGRKPGIYTVAECLDDYLNWLRQYKKSAKHVTTYANAYILPSLGKIDTAKLTAAMIRSWVERIAIEPPRQRTKKGKPQRYREEDRDPQEAQRKRQLRANRHLVILRAALNRAWREGAIAHADAWQRVQLFHGVERQRNRILSVDEARRLMNAADLDMRDLVQAALLTGARYGELCAFKVADFHPDIGQVHVRISKSGKARYIVLNDEGTAFFRYVAAGKKPNDFLLQMADGEPWARDLHRRRFKEAVARAAIEKSFTFHELRHTWASLTIMAGAPLLVVAQNLGHRDTRMVEEHYGHLTKTFVVETIRRTAPRFGMAPGEDVVPLRLGQKR